jgi:hypothetical protein
LSLQGGAEQLMLDIALGLKQRDYLVQFYTGYHNRKNSFDETVDGFASHPFSVSNHPV